MVNGIWMHGRLGSIRNAGHDLSSYSRAGPFGTIIAMTVSTLIMLIIGYNFAFLMNRSPGAGGVYSYTKEAFGRDHAFLSPWFLCLSYITIVFLNGTALFVVLRTIFGDSIQTGFYYNVSGNKVILNEILVSVSALAGVGVLFITAKKYCTRYILFSLSYCLLVSSLSQ